MSLERGVRLAAGLFVMLSLALGIEASPMFASGKFLWLTGFVGFMLFQSSLTGFCPMAMILKGVGLKSAP